MELRKLPHVILGLTIVFFMFSSCEKKTDDSKIQVNYKDDLGYDVEIINAPKRIISLAPNLTEIIFSVGADSLLVGVTDFCNYPSGVINKNKVGGIINPNLEAIISLKPDLVLATADGNPKPTVEKLKAAGIPVYVFNINRYQDVLGCIGTIGKLTAHESGADSIIQVMKTVNEDLIKISNKPGVFLVLNRNPIITASGGSFLNDVLNLAGGTNVIGEMKERYPTMNRESIIQLNPDFFIIPEKDFQPLPENEYADFSSLSTVSAVRNKKIYYMNPDIILRPGPRLILGIKQLNSILSQ